jgi:outer membrane protein assembly factor BamC
LYFVRYVSTTSANSDPGLIAKWFGGAGSGKGPEKYRIAVRSQGNATTVSVLNASGTPETSDIAQRIIKVLADDIR